MAWDVFKRVKNAVYTTAENYGVSVDMSGSDSKTDTERVTVATGEAFVEMGLTEDEALSLIMHSAAHEGAHVKLSDISPVRDCLKQAKSDGANVKKLGAMINIAEDYRVDSVISDERPGYWQERSDMSEITKKLFKDKPSPDLEFNTLKAASALTHGIDLHDCGWESDVDWSEAEELARELESIARESKTSGELIDSVYKYYKTRYEVEPHTGGGSSDDESSDGDDVSDSDSAPSSGGESFEDKSEDASDSEGEKSKPDSHSKSSKSSDSDHSDDESCSEGGSSTSDLDDDTDLDEAIKELEKSMSGKDTLKDLLGDEASEKLDELKEDKEDSYKSLDEYKTKSDKKKSNIIRTEHYKSLWGKEEQNRIENELCVDIHAGADIMYVERTKPEYPTVSTSELKQQDMIARKLGNNLKQVLKAEKDDRGEIASSGAKIIANKVWKPIHTGDSNVFYRRDFTESGGYVIDLILDASGSQRSREADVCKQAYIIAEACSIAEIPCRVTQFDNQDTFTILERLRDFDDPRDKNLNCGTYRAGYDNRDGLAIKMANVELQKRPEPNKIMLVLSDGTPCDNSGVSKINAFGGLGHYSISHASDTLSKQRPIIDVYNAVREIRKKGTAIMGIYVGSDYSLEAEKMMYGSDFAYIGNDMSNFSDVIMKYLVKHIQGFDK